ncbi:MAG TPA: hypothetical protein VI815_04120 [Candidatus Nanoarchaeia archaeon]|nr:hypothetical protein [Candidatus Nanoarchaeia archaeon]
MKGTFIGFRNGKSIYEVIIESPYESIPLPECLDCPYRISSIENEKWLRVTRYVQPVSDIKSCQRDYCIIERPERKNE